ncbi:hypothetical protein JHK82_012660 [Glycine max]|uniref:Uncharacterized protein n=2 Tax=Glycine subgen. Soja TaxID=1462606 RepID=A0A0R0JTT5_SOYBN|nr:hypothetical protein JHK85_013015 [Glycine max]KAG5057685.1 hypothetical protein JHK86_012681 [Glycine max]KAG5154691.1 hypothetical protein JHK82_012660 [Glycine max]KRH58238.1 hypothetical protein GLYMA_05G114600v4 [Glycine max]RZC12026.1 hypothetical protein D0Y65_012010 [Glycine soja]
MLGLKHKRVQHKRLVHHFKLLNVRLLTLSPPLRADVHNGFHSINTDPMIVLSLERLHSSISIQFDTLIQPIGSPFHGPTLNESTNC